MAGKASGRKPKESERRSRIRYNPDPDYTRPLFDILPEAHKRMFGRLSLLYGEAVAKAWMPELELILRMHYAYKPQDMIEVEKEYDPRERFTEEDINHIVQRATEHGAYVSYRMTEDRTEEPYEINSTWWSAINGNDRDEDIARGRPAHSGYDERGQQNEHR